MCSVFENGTDVIPVKLEVKEFIDKPNRLYVAVALEGIKKDRVVSMGVPSNRSHVRTSPVTISIRELFSKINPLDVDFLKYIPRSFLTNEQMISPQQSAVGPVSRTQNSDVARDFGVEIGVRPAEMDTVFKKMSAKQKNCMWIWNRTRTVMWIPQERIVD